MLNDPLVRAHNNREIDWLVFMLGLMQEPGELDELLMATIGDEIFISSAGVRSRLLQTIRHACKALPQNLFVDPEQIEMLWLRFQELAAVSFRREMMEMRMEMHDGLADDNNNNTKER